MPDVLFIQLAIVILTAGIISFFAFKLRQPLIIAYIITGLIVGPSLFGNVQTQEIFQSFTQIGIAFLLFLVGLNLNWRQIKDVGAIAVLSGIGQIAFTTLLGYGLAVQLGFDITTSVLLGLALALSSTIVVVKMLSDKEDLDRFYGRLSLGILLVQDIVAMMILLVISAMGGEEKLASMISTSLIQGVAAIVLLWLAAKYLLPPLLRYAARSQELLFLTAIAWCFTVASVLHLMGFGIEIGALLAGISLGGTGFQREIATKIRPLRDFFLIIFFIILGTQLTFDNFTASLLPALIFSLFVLIGKPLITILILRVFDYHPRTGFLVGTSIAQVSEFSFIIISSAIAINLVDKSILSTTTMIGLITIAISSYFITYNEKLYEKLSFIFNWFAPKENQNEKKRAKVVPIILCGYHRIGSSVLAAIKELGKDYLIVDFDPKAISELEASGEPHIYGDAASEDLLHDIRAEKSKMVISTIPDESINKDILRYLQHKKFKGTSIVTAKTADEAERLYQAGAAFVIVPNVLGGKLFAQIVKKSKINKASWKALSRKQRK